jgi:hypothetical protein
MFRTGVSWTVIVMDLFSGEFEWSGCAGRFAGRVFSDTDSTYYRVRVDRLDEPANTWCHFHVWESRNPSGNTLAEFAAWQLRATGHRVTSVDFTGRPEYVAELARWEGAPRCACGAVRFPCDQVTTAVRP